MPETVTAPRTDPVYNCHGYLTKVPIAAIEPFIQTFTQPGDTIADFFAGSGMTGLAAVRLGRKAKLSDIAVLGRHIAQGYLIEVGPQSLRAAANDVTAKARRPLGDLYTTRRKQDGAAVEMVRTVWSFTYVCPNCKSEMTYYRHLSPKGAPPKTCPSCDAPFVRRNWPRGADLPVEVVARTKEGRLAEQPVSAFDRQTI
jgi:hypothetical protein